VAGRPSSTWLLRFCVGDGCGKKTVKHKAGAIPALVEASAHVMQEEGVLIIQFVVMEACLRKGPARTSLEGCSERNKPRLPCEMLSLECLGLQFVCRERASEGHGEGILSRQRGVESSLVE
jgi:hypothetical protein